MSETRPRIRVINPNSNEAVTRALQFAGLFKDGKSFDKAKFRMTQDFSVVGADAQPAVAGDVLLHGRRQGGAGGQPFGDPHEHGG